MQISFKTVLAPMEGITNPIIRRAISRCGSPGLLCTEFIRVSVSVPSEKSIAKQLDKVPGVPLSVQIMGNDPQLMGDSARRMEESGADIVDINMGCPTKRALKGNVGAAMLRDEKLMRSVLTSMRSSVKGTFSAKMRAGVDSDSRAVEIAQGIEDCGVDFVAVHPRKRSDAYRGRADWRIIADICNAVSIPVIGNGDVNSFSDAMKMFEETGCAAVMVGRGAIRNPWIFRQIEEELSGKDVYLPGIEDYLSFYQDIISGFSLTKISPKGLLSRLKELMMYQLPYLEEPLTYRQSIGRSESVEEILLCFESYFKQYQKDLNRICGH